MLISALFISMSLMPGIKGCDAVQWHTGSYLTVLLCTHWWKLPWRPRSSEGGMPVCIQMLELLGEAHPSGGLIGSFVSAAWLLAVSVELQEGSSRVTETLGAREGWGLGTVFPVQPTADCASQPAVRLLVLHRGWDLPSLFVACCLTDGWCQRGFIPPDVDMAHLSCLDTPSNKQRTRDVSKDWVTLSWQPKQALLIPPKTA